MGYLPKFSLINENEILKIRGVQKIDDFLRVVECEFEILRVDVVSREQMGSDDFKI